MISCYFVGLIYMRLCLITRHIFAFGQEACSLLYAAPRLCRFRNDLVEGGVLDDLLSEVCRQLEDHGLKVKEAEAAIIDATLIQSAARPNGYIDETKVAQDREETAISTTQNEVHYSADKEATWIKKGKKSLLGYKGYERCDAEGMIEKVHVTPANKEDPCIIVLFTFECRNVHRR